MSLSVGGAMLIGLIGLAGLVYRSLRISQPVIDIRVLKNSSFSGHVVAFFILQVASLGLSFILPNYMQLVNGSTSTIAGLVVLPGAAIGAAMSPISGRLLDNLGAKKPIFTGVFIVLIGLALFTLLALNMGNLAILVIYVIYMIGIGLIFGNIMTNSLSVLNAAQQTDGNAILNTLQQFAGAMGTSIVSAIIAMSQLSGHGSLARLTAIGSRNALLVLTLLVIVAIGMLIYAVNLGEKQKVNRSKR